MINEITQFKELFLNTETTYQAEHRSTKQIDRVVAFGMGGSGIATEYIESYFQKFAKYDAVSVPQIEIVKSYSIPAWLYDTNIETINRTLFLFVSYSANTEETIHCFNELYKAASYAMPFISAEVICHHENKLADLAYSIGVPVNVIKFDGEPRSALPETLATTIRIFDKFGCIAKSTIQRMTEHVESLSVMQISKTAKQFAIEHYSDKLKGFVFVATNDNQALAIRAKQQIVENSKLLAWHTIVPEMTHNEIVGMSGSISDDLLYVFMHTSDDIDSFETKQNEKRLIFLEKLATETKQNHVSVEFENVMHGTLLFDYVSYYIAELRNVNPKTVDVINSLKAFVAKD